VAGPPSRLKLFLLFDRDDRFRRRLCRMGIKENLLVLQKAYDRQYTTPKTRAVRLSDSTLTLPEGRAISITSLHLPVISPTSLPLRWIFP
jgi:hypothetical protein